MQRRNRDDVDLTRFPADALPWGVERIVDVATALPMCDPVGRLAVLVEREPLRADLAINGRDRRQQPHRPMPEEFNRRRRVTDDMLRVRIIAVTRHGARFRPGSRPVACGYAGAFERFDFGEPPKSTAGAEAEFDWLRKGRVALQEALYEHVRHATPPSPKRSCIDEYWRRFDLHGRGPQSE